MKGLIVVVLFSLAFFVNTSFVSAHPGNTASDGCHYCRTNCDRWGVAWNERHCHGGGAVAPVQQTQQVIYSTPTPIPTSVYVVPTDTPAPTLTPIPTFTPIPTEAKTEPTVVLTSTPISSSTSTIEPTSSPIVATSKPTAKKSFWRLLLGFLFNL